MYAMEYEHFSAWIQVQMKSRGLSQANLARLANTTRSAINGLIQGTRGPGPDLCLAIARGLNLPPEVVFRAAGLLPPRPATDEASERARYLFDSYASSETKARALEYLEFLKLQEEKGNPAPSRKPKIKPESLKKALGA